jgi:site-specific DNA recombinase
VREVKKLYAAVLIETFNDKTSTAAERKRRLLEQIKDYESRLSNARDLLSSMQIDPSDYKMMKHDYEEKITKLESKLAEVSNDKYTIDDLLNKGLDNLISLNNRYVDSGLAQARDLIGLIYPENFTIRGTEVQTTRTNKIIESI